MSGNRRVTRKRRQSREGRRRKKEVGREHPNISNSNIIYRGHPDG